MDQTCLCSHYNLTKEQYNRYVEKKIIDPEGELTDEILRRIGLVMTMEGMGIDLDTISRYLLLLEEKEKNQKELIGILRNQRCRMMEELHEKQRKVDQLDYMLYELKKLA